MKTLAASVRQLLEYTEGQGTLRWQQLTFEPSAKRRRRLEPRTFWTELALRQFVQSGEYLKYDTVRVLLEGYKNRHEVEVEFYHEKVLFVVGGLVVWSYRPEAIDG